jgi:hypothetical protein
LRAYQLSPKEQFVTRSRTLLAAAGTCLALALTACSGDGAGSDNNAQAPASSAAASSAPSSSAGSTGTADSATVAWVDQFCGALSPLMELTRIERPDIQSNDPAAAKQALSDIVGTFQESVGSTLDGMNKLGPAPVPAGDQAKQAVVDTFTPIHEQVKEAKAQLDAAEPTDRQAMLNVVQSIGNISSGMGEDPLTSVEESPELSAAGMQAPNCQKLEG